MLKLLSDKRTPTCPHCGMAKLEIDDVIDHWVEGGENNTDVYVELVIGVCLNCGRSFEYKQKYTHDPIGYDDIDYCDADEEEEEDE